MLNKKQIKLILDLIAEKYGAGYSDDDEIFKLQSTLSIMLEAKL